MERNTNPPNYRDTESGRHSARNVRISVAESLRLGVLLIISYDTDFDELTARELQEGDTAGG
jgi:hypothetical protein